MLFVWKVTQLPFGIAPIQQSPVFSFLGAEWFLSLHSSNLNYSVHLQKTTQWGNFQSFEVSAGIEDDNVGSWTKRCQRVRVNNGHNVICVIHASELLKKRPAFGSITTNSCFMVFCILHSESPSGLKKEWKHQSIQASLELPSDLEGLSQDLRNLLEKGTMPDVNLKCGDGTVPAHRSVLTARSEVFAAMFRNDMAESRSGVVDMPDVDSEVLGLLLKYVYTGKLPEASVDIMCKLYAASNKYAIHGMMKACSEWMTGGLTEENCLDYLVIADAHCDATFKDAVVSFMVDNQGVLLGSSVWFRFQEQQPKLSLEVFNRCFLKWQPGNASSCQK